METAYWIALAICAPVTLWGSACGLWLVRNRPWDSRASDDGKLLLLACGTGVMACLAGSAMMYANSLP